MKPGKNDTKPLTKLSNNFLEFWTRYEVFCMESAYYCYDKTHMWISAS
jgi:hypothetical protein